MRFPCGLAIALLVAARMAAGQDVPPASPGQVQALRDALQNVQAQLAETRREADALRQKLETLEAQLATLQKGVAAAPATADQDLLAAKVEEQEQTKVSSGSKYRMRLSGFVLVNLFGTHGSVDSLDVPQLATPGTDGGAFGASVRQSNVSLEVFGAELGGARTSGDLSFDFFGGFPVTSEGVSAPLVRLKTARVMLDWANTSLLAGQDTPFFSPRSPSSLAATAYPALSSAGNLWVWTPQVRVERRGSVGEHTQLTAQVGILDPLTGELPEEYERIATAGERTGAPAEAARIGLQHAFGAHALDVGGGGYYSRQSWNGTGVNAWAVTGDWDVPLGPVFSVSGEIYHGEALGGFGGGASVGVIVDPVDGVIPVRSSGGWMQLAAQATPRVAFHAAYGRDDSRPSVVPVQSLVILTPAIVNRNASAFVNTIIQARSNFLFSLEYRHLWTTGLDDVTHRAHHFSFTTGIGF